MKGVKKKVMDIANYLGLSNAIMKAVGDREKVDAIITYCVMAFLFSLFSPNSLHPLTVENRI